MIPTGRRPSVSKALALLAPLVLLGCGEDASTSAPASGGAGGAAGGPNGGAAGQAATGGRAGASGANGGSAGVANGGSAGVANGGSAGVANGGSAGVANGGSAGVASGGSAGVANGGSAGVANGGSAGAANGGSAGAANGGSAGVANGGSAGVANGGSAGAANGGSGGNAGGATTLPFLTGTNLSGGEYVKENYPGKHGTNYIYPRPSDYDYFIGKGLRTFRVPLKWEQFQPDLEKPVRAEELTLFKQGIDYALSKGATIVLDPHNYARYRGKVIGSGNGAATDAQLAAFWTALAGLWANEPRVILGLMNEPNGLGDGGLERWLVTVNTTIAALRQAKIGNLVLVPGTSWTGAHSWMNANAKVMIDVKDPSNNFAYEMHQYLDSDYSGTHDTCQNATIGSTKMKAATEWLKANKRRAFLGEFAGADNEVCRQALADLLGYIDQNRDVWMGWTYWSAGAWVSNDDPFVLQPTKDGNDRPQLAELLKHP